MLFDQDWQRELLGRDVESATEAESKATHEAINKIEAIRKIESGRRIVALPLVSGERVVGVLEGVRTRSGARLFSRSEAASPHDPDNSHRFRAFEFGADRRSRAPVAD